jgi:hypothetical protein
MVAWIIKTHMGDVKSQSIYIDLYVQLVYDVADSYPSNEALLDLNKIKKRISREGFSFLTKTLPGYAKTLDRVLASSSESTLTLPGLQKRPGSAIPKLFGWLFERIIGDDGKIRSDADPNAIYHCRQLLYFMYKIAIPYEEKTTQKVVTSFIQTEGDLDKVTINSADIVVQHARQIVARVLSGVSVRDIVPKHGPGAVSTGERTAGKSKFSRIYSALETIYPFTEYMMLGANQIIDQIDYIGGLRAGRSLGDPVSQRRLTPGSRHVSPPPIRGEIHGRGWCLTRDGLLEPTAKVILVPKDSRGPRLISCEPLEIQYIQQGIRKLLYDAIEGHYLTKGHVSFRDQTTNRRLALAASRTQQYATLDMKDASDRVSLDLVKTLFRDIGLLDALLATRSTRTRLPDGTVIGLRKFAPMGSALCFPVLALTVFSLAAAVIRIHGKTSMRKACQSVYVYGDDIIVDQRFADLIMQYLPLFGLKLNVDKSCVSGFFRESCGCDAYKGVDVTPIRLRKTWCPSTRDSGQLTSYVSLSNSLWERGYWRASDYIQQLVERAYGHLPYVTSDVDWRWNGNPNQVPVTPLGGTGLIGWRRSHVCEHEQNKQRGIPWRFNASLCRLEYKGYAVKPRLVKGHGGWQALLRTLVEKTGGESHTDPDTYAVPRSSCLTRRWAAIQ